MARFNKIAIIGVGLIGGSIGLAIKKKRLAREVVGVFRHQATLRRALKYRAIDKATMHIKEGVKGADLIILASQVYSIPAVAKEVIKYAKDNAIITDVGSTKKWIVDKIEKMLQSSPSVFFVGSHPMAGSEHAGVEFAKADLLEGAPCIVVKTANTSQTALCKTISFWKALGAKPKVMGTSEHDRKASLVSHLPHLVAFSLAGAVPQKDIIYAAEGFKDTTRVASSDPRLWADIFLSNKTEVLKAAKIFNRYYSSIIKALSKGDYLRVAGLLAKAKSKRDKFVYGKTA